MISHKNSKNCPFSEYVHFKFLSITWFLYLDQCFHCWKIITQCLSILALYLS